MVDIPFTQSDSEVEVGVPYAKTLIYSTILVTIFYLRLVDIKIFNSETLLCLKFCIYLFYWIYSPSLTRFSIFQPYIYHSTYWYYVRKHTKSNSNHVACMVLTYSYLQYCLSFLLSHNHSLQSSVSKSRFKSFIHYPILLKWHILRRHGLILWFYAELNKFLTIFTNELVVYNNDNFKLFYFPYLNTVLRKLANWNFYFFLSHCCYITLVL